MSSVPSLTLRARGDNHWRSGDPPRALADWLAAREQGDASVDLAFNIAVALKAIGDADQAAALFQVLSVGERRLEALSHLADLFPDRIAGSIVLELTRASADPAVPLGRRCTILFTLGKLFDRRRRYEEAFAAYAAGAALRRTAFGDQPARAEAEEIRFLKFAQTTFTPAFLRATQGGGSDSIAPIFVIGLPRSGTTLVEQVLATHADVVGLGESDTFNRVVSGRYPYAPAATAPPDHFRRLGNDYLNAMRAQGWSGAGRFVDKTPANLWAVGLIRLMFPRATILHTVRDPIETCLSNFQQLFEKGNPLSYDLADLGSQFVRYRQAMDHWNAVLPGVVTDVRLDELTADPDAQIPALVAAAGLTWDEACLRFYDNPRPVLTASAAQVRRPMTPTPSGRWRAYERHLGPLMEALGPYAPARREEG